MKKISMFSRPSFVHVLFSLARLC